MERFHPRADFAAVYISEAHASDEWPISEAPRSFQQHVSMSDRVAAAKAFISDFHVAPQVRWFADTMDNSFNKAYASWPFRFWVLTPDQVLLKPMPVDATYDIAELSIFLQALTETV